MRQSKGALSRVLFSFENKGSMKHKSSKQGANGIKRDECGMQHIVPAALSSINILFFSKTFNVQKHVKYVDVGHRKATLEKML